MSQRMHYHCDCGEPDCAAGERSINEHDTPIVVYLVAGHVNGGGDVDLDALDPWIAALLRQPVSRIELHAGCASKVLARMLAMPRPAPESTLPPPPSGA